MREYIRLATPDDARNILELYKPFSDSFSSGHGQRTPDLKDFAIKLANIARSFPYLVYVINEKIVGIGYATKYSERNSCRFNADLSVFVSNNFVGQGISKKLYTALFNILKVQGFFNAIVSILLPADANIKLHTALGFIPIGVAHNADYKYNSWHDVLLMQKSIQYPILSPPPPRPITVIPIAVINDILKAFSIY